MRTYPFKINIPPPPPSTSFLPRVYFLQKLGEKYPQKLFEANLKTVNRNY